MPPARVTGKQVSGTTGCVITYPCGTNWFHLNDSGVAGLDPPNRLGGVGLKETNDVFSGFGTTVFEVMSRLAIEHGAVNLGQGFPDDNGPEDVRAKAAEALEDRPNQYPPMMGVPELRQALAAHGKRFYDLDVDWHTETMVTSGATEALAACFLGLVSLGDEVVMIEP